MSDIDQNFEKLKTKLPLLDSFCSLVLIFITVIIACNVSDRETKSTKISCRFQISKHTTEFRKLITSVISEHDAVTYANKDSQDLQKFIDKLEEKRHLFSDPICNHSFSNKIDRLTSMLIAREKTLEGKIQKSENIFSLSTLLLQVDTSKECCI